MVVAVEVVFVEVVSEVAAQAGEADLQVPGERGPPAFLEDRAVQAFDVSVGLGPSGADLAVADASGQSAGEGLAPELVAVVGEHALKLPARGLEFCCDSAGQGGGVLDGRPGRGADGQIGPRVAGVGVDRGDLPDRAAGAVQPPDKETVQADQLARPAGVDVRLGVGLARRLLGRAVPGHQRQPLGARVQAVTDQRLIDPVR